MRRLLLLLAIATVALVAAACSSAATPGWTYAPPTPSPTPGPSVAASGAAPSAGASAEAPSAGASAAAPSAGASEAPGGAAGGDVVNISAIGIQFEQSQVSAPAGKPFIIRFDNKEAVPHNVDIKDASGSDVFKGDIVTGPTQVDYNVPALAAGSYTFSCVVHPNMTGTLTVGS